MSVIYIISNLKKHMKKTFIFFIITAILTSCSVLGTRTIYKSNSGIEKATRIGFSQLAHEDIVEQIAKGSSLVYRNIMSGELSSRNILSNVILIKDFNKLESVNSNVIEKICRENMLEGIIITQLRFLNIKYSNLFIQPGKTFDTEVEMQYYNSNGKLLLHTKHNTKKGNTYFDFPKVERTVKDGIVGALTRIMEELDK